MAKIYKGKRVSNEWYTILKCAEEDIFFVLNSGQRTIQEQWNLYNLYRSGKGNLAAYPNPNAPHIKTPNHSIDVDTYSNGANNLVKWLKKEGASSATLDVPGEPWHITIKSEAEFYKLYLKCKENDKWKDYTEAETRWIKEYDTLVRQAKDIQRRKILRREMKKQRQRIWRAAQVTGWKRHNRLARYNSLLARTK